jgi:hypothetical protein
MSDTSVDWADNKIVGKDKLTLQDARRPLSVFMSAFFPPTRQIRHFLLAVVLVLLVFAWAGLSPGRERRTGETMMLVLNSSDQTTTGLSKYRLKTIEDQRGDQFNVWLLTREARRSKVTH